MTDSASPLDDRARFYLSHRAEIEEWAALRGEATAAISQYLSGIGPTIEDALADLDEAIIVQPYLDYDNWPRFVCCLPDWPVEAEHGHAVIAVVLEWDKNRVALDSPDLAPYTGVRIEMNDPLGPPLRAAFMARARTTRDRERWQHQKMWPAWDRWPAEGAYWDDLDAYRDLAVERLVHTWNTFAGFIAQAVEATRPPAS